MLDVLIVGYGDIGRRVARLEQADGRAVTVLVRRPDKLADDPPPQPPAITHDLDAAQARFSLPDRPATLYWFAPPADGGVEDARLDRFLQTLLPHHRPGRLVYISTSGVYGDCQGAWVDETRPPAPRTDRARRRLAAERCLLARAERGDMEVVILRVPGIYGPGRLPIERLRQGIPVITPGEAPYSNRIHADDLARVCVAAARYPGPTRVFNVSDGHPTTMTDYFMQVARWLGMPPPPCISLAEAKTCFSASQLSFVEESRRLDTRLLREQIGFHPLYPDLAHGLPACL